MNKMMILLVSACAVLLSAFAGAAADDQIDRTVLPIHVPELPLVTEMDARNVDMPPPFAVTAPAKAPNILIVLVDDMGFGVTDTFGGPVSMPTLSALAETGLRYNRMHTTALCAPTRTALLSGRNHHMNNMGSITETATGFIGQTGQTPANVASVAKVLRLNGFSTAQFGKNHETAAWEVSPSGPTDRWPTRQGFDKFYGFFGGETNQWAPLIYDGMSPVETPDDPDYNFMTDMANEAIEWISFQQALTPDKPFFVYFAPGATHAPHHVPEEWAAKYKGKFDKGWDQLREDTLKRQIELGVVPEGTQLAKKPGDIKDWDTLSADEKRMFARQMEVFAGFAEYADYEIGRVIDNLEAIGELDNTLIFYIAGDNGTSAEGGMNGVYNEYTALNGLTETVADQLVHYEEWGNEMTYPHMAAGWAVAGDTPFAWTKQVASDFGGTRNGMVINWPERIKQRGEIRSQFAHVIDVVPTILEATGIPEPTHVNGVEQTAIQGTSLAYTFDDADAEERHTSQYFEIFANRAYYQDGWLARVVHKQPWDSAPLRSLQDDIWELYNANEDFSLSKDIAEEYPEKLKELQDEFMRVAAENRVLPLDDRGLERLNAAVAGRPDLMGGRTSLTLTHGMKDISENAFINIKNQSKHIVAEVSVPEGGGEGVIIAQGGRFGGWSLYLDDGVPTYTYNYIGLENTSVVAEQPLAAGTFEVRLDFAYDGGGSGKGGLATMSVNGEEVASGRIERTQPAIFSADETADVAVDGATPVVESYAATRGAFTGRVNKVTVSVGE